MYQIIVKDLENGTEDVHDCNGFILGVTTDVEDDNVEIGTTIANMTVVESEYVIQQIANEVDKFSEANQWLNEDK